MMHTLHINRPPSPEPIRTISYPRNRHQQQSNSSIDHDSRINRYTRQRSGILPFSSEYSSGSSTSSVHSLYAIRIMIHPTRPPPTLQPAVLHTPVIMPHIQRRMRPCSTAAPARNHAATLSVENTSSSSSSSSSSLDTCASRRMRGPGRRV